MLRGLRLCGPEQVLLRHQNHNYNHTDNDHNSPNHHNRTNHNHPAQLPVFVPRISRLRLRLYLQIRVQLPELHVLLHTPNNHNHHDNFASADMFVRF